MESVLSVGIKDNVVLIRALGEMRAGNCFALNEFLMPYLERVRENVRIYLDLEKCDYMDSTFIGFIVALEGKCGRYCPESVTVLRPAERCRSVLKKLSVLTRLHIDDDAAAPDLPVFALQSDPRAFIQRQNVQLMFEAHRLLGEVSQENRREFQDLLDELKKVLERG
jgi:anti-anti-sigma factor